MQTTGYRVLREMSLMIGVSVAAASAASAQQWTDTSFVSPMFLSTTQLYGDKNNEDLVVAEQMQATFNVGTTDTGITYDITGNRLGAVDRHALRDFDAQVGMILLRDDVKVVRTDDMPATTIYYPVKETKHSNDLNIAPFVVLHPLANLHVSLKFDAHDYTTTDSVRYQASGTQPIDAAAPAYKRGYNRLVPGASWTTANLRLMAEYTPLVNIHDDNGIIVIPLGFNLGAQYLLNDKIRLDSAFKYLQWSALYTTYSNQWDAMLGARWLVTTEWALAAYIDYAPSFARHAQYLAIDNIETLDVAMHAEYQWSASWLLTVMALHEQGSGWSQSDDTGATTRTNYKKSREDLVAQLSYRY